MSNTTGMESTQSTTIQFYYKGFSILLTKRSDDISMQKLLMDAMLDIDWAITRNVDPSWNKETNEQTKKDINTPIENKPVIEKKAIPVSEFEKVCERCGSPKFKSKKGNMVCSKFCWYK